VLIVGVVLVSFPPALPAQVDASWIGKDLVMTRDDVQLKAQDPATGRTRIIGTIDEAQVRLDKIQGTWLWVRTPTREGWITQDDAIPADQAISYFSDRIRRNSNDGYAYNQRSNAWADRGDLDKAMADITEAIRLGPLNPVLRHNRGVIWQEKGDFEKAVADYSESLRLE
jgi:tetratricopeptide (TPR) repeat protein